MYVSNDAQADVWAVAVVMYIFLKVEVIIGDKSIPMAEKDFSSAYIFGQKADLGMIREKLDKWEHTTEGFDENVKDLLGGKSMLAHSRQLCHNCDSGRYIRTCKV